MSDRSNDMIPRTPLGGIEPRVDTHGPVTLTEVTNTSIASFASRLGQESTAQDVLAKFLGTAVPEAGRAVFGDALGAFWTGPDQWMVTAPHTSHEDLAAQLVPLANGSASITEQNDAWCRFDLSGDGLADVFERLCPFNIRACSGGEATRTSIDHLGCFVVVADPTHIMVMGPRSSAGSLHHALMTAIRSAH